MPWCLVKCSSLSFDDVIQPSCAFKQTQKSYAKLPLSTQSLFTTLPKARHQVIYAIMSERVKEVAREEIEQVKALATDAAKSGAYLYPVKVKAK